MVAMANAWSEEQKCSGACALLVGSAAYWLESFTFTSWEEFVKGIKQSFQDDPDQAIQDVMTIQQQMHEGLEDLRTDTK